MNETFVLHFVISMVQTLGAMNMFIIIFEVAVSYCFTTVMINGIVLCVVQGRLHKYVFAKNLERDSC